MQTAAVCFSIMLTCMYNFCTQYQSCPHVHTELSDAMLPKPLPLISHCAFFGGKTRAMSAQPRFTASHLPTDTPQKLFTSNNTFPQPRGAWASSVPNLSHYPAELHCLVTSSHSSASAGSCDTAAVKRCKIYSAACHWEERSPLLFRAWSMCLCMTDRRQSETRPQ